MKATLKFDLPEEQPEFQDAVNGTAWKAVVFNLFQWLHTLEENDKEQLSVDEVRSQLCELLEANNPPLSID